MFVAQMSTQNFDFVGVGETKTQAEDAVAAAFSEHLVRYNPGQTTHASVREHFAYGVGEEASELDLLNPEVWHRILDEQYGFYTVDLVHGQAVSSDGTVYPYTRQNPNTKEQ